LPKQTPKAARRCIAWQLERFARMTADWPAAASFPVSMANSAAILRYPQTAHAWVRPGIMLYGGSPFAAQDAASLDLKPVMTLRSRILAVQEIAVGERVGYGGTFVAQRPTRVGVVACGYADGYPRHAPGGTPIVVAGRRTQTLGRVSMDMLACDLTDLPAAGVDSPVVLWGEGLPADEVASAAGPSATSCSAPWRGVCRWSKSEHGTPRRQPEDRFFLYRVRRQRGQVAGTVPRLRGLEHPRRDDCRSARRGSQPDVLPRLAAVPDCRRFPRSKRAKRTACRPASASSIGRSAAGWSAAASC
jgi:hypothetical protein